MLISEQKFGLILITLHRMAQINKSLNNASRRGFLLHYQRGQQVWKLLHNSSTWKGKWGLFVVLFWRQLIKNLLYHRRLAYRPLLGNGVPIFIPAFSLCQTANQSSCLYCLQIIDSYEFPVWSCWIRPMANLIWNL
jgi:hypothetical protein